MTRKSSGSYGEKLPYTLPNNDVPTDQDTLEKIEHSFKNFPPINQHDIPESNVDKK
jgi:hypothetical protein